MFRNSTSGADGFLAGMGIPIPDWLAYGPIAIVLCMSMHYYAFSYIMVSGALRSINSELEEMGEIQGASKAQILRHITLPPDPALRALRHRDDHQQIHRYIRRPCQPRQPHRLLHAGHQNA